MSEMAERVAKAMKERGGIVIADSFWQEIAKAAIETMREPTEEMSLVDLDPENSTRTWQKMIDAALK